MSPLSAQRLQVYILAGQSNMQGHAKIATFDAIGDDPATAPLLATMRDERGQPVVCSNVWISDLTHAADGDGDGEGHGPLTAGYGARRDPTKPGDQIGPEFTFGIAVGRAHRGPVLLIKTAWGGKSLHTDFRPPSAGPFVFAESQLAAWRKDGKDVDKIQADKVAATGRYYRAMIAHVRAVLADPARVCPAYDRDAGYELAGFVWFQGWNDMVDSGVYPRRQQPDGYAAYSECLAHLIRDVRKDLAVPKLPFVIGVMGVGGVVADGDQGRKVHRNFQAAMAQPASLPEFVGDVAAVRTAEFWDAGLAAIVDKLEQVREFERKIRQASDAGLKQTDDQIAAQVQAIRAKMLTADEERALARGVSNAAYHYLGSAKILARAGDAFAAAVLQLRR